MYSDIEDEAGVYYRDRREVHSDPDMDAADLDDRAVAAKSEELTAAMEYYYRFDDEKSDFRRCFADVCSATAASAGAKDDGGDADDDGHGDAAAGVTVKHTDTADANKRSAAAADDEHVQQQQRQRYLGNVLDDADTALYPPRDPAAWQPALVHEGRPLQHSPASHFFMQHLASGALVLLPVSVLVNRQQMRDKHSDLLVRTTKADDDSKDGNDDDDHDKSKDNKDDEAAVATPVDFGIGYLAGIATGWAMPRTTDAAVLAQLKALYPGWRAATQDDLPMFMRDFVPRDGPDAAGRHHPLQRHLTWRMRSGELLAETVAVAGGWAHVRLVALDVVAAYVISQRAVPLPLEMAFATVTDTMAHTRSCNNKNNNDDDDNNNNNHGSRQKKADDDAKDDDVCHFFVHPGHVPDTDKACYNALHIHGVPFDKAAFLRRDYDVLARRLARAFLDDVHTIFVCHSLPTYKPATMQFQALRWLFAAAAATTTATTTRTASEGDMATSLPIPPPASIRCFDVATVLGALQSLTAQHEEENNKNNDKDKYNKDNAMDGDDGDVDDDDVCSCVSTPCSDAAGADDGTCWYHERAEALWGDYRALHCARRSAVHLRDRLRTAWAHAVAASAAEDDVQKVNL